LAQFKIILKPTQFKDSILITNKFQMSRKVAKDLPKIEVAETTEKIKVVDEENISNAIENIEVSKKTRQVPTKETVLTGFDEIIEMIDDEIKKLNQNSSKNTNIKFLRSLNKTVKSLRGQSARVMKQKSLTPRHNNHNSGFQKPVKISNELSKFTGWPQDELRSRVDVTKYICDYIASNKLQNPEDKRQILPDVKLQKLLGFNPAKAEKPLYYYGIQTHLKNQNHFPKD
jgi:chromatin remodeling complex protein RSC6